MIKMQRLLVLCVTLTRATDFCTPHCESQFAACIASCGNDASCQSDCTRELPECQSHCSTHQFLVLARTKFGIFEANGLVDQIDEYEPLKFKYHNHEVDMACAVAYHDQFYILGGFDKPHRVSIVNGCGLQPQPSLTIPGDYEWIAHKCTVHHDTIWMCGSISSSNTENVAQTCKSLSDDGIWSDEPMFQVQHQQGGLVSVRDELLIIGGRTTAVEVLDNSAWSFYEANITAVLNSFTTIVHNDQPYLFGGYGLFEQDYSDRIWTYLYEEQKWQVVGFMAIPRMNFRSIKIDNVVYSAGGLGDDMKIERFDFESMVSNALTIGISNVLYPEIVPVGYYNCE